MNAGCCSEYGENERNYDVMLSWDMATGYSAVALRPREESGVNTFGFEVI
jgi:hypothetical protein